MAEYKLERYTKAQRADYDTALSEIKKGKKRSHWMWYIFPQLKGLGYSSTSQYYGITDIGEARAFLEDEYLGGNLMEISSAIMGLKTDDITSVLGYPDDMKLQSCMTLFAVADPDCEVFFRVLDKYYDGQPCKKTLKLLGEEWL